MSCVVMPPLKSSAAFHEQRRGLERAQTEHCHKRKIRSESESPEPIRMHILDERSGKPQLQQKKLRLANDLNNKIAHRPGPIELIHKNILPVDSCFKQAIIERRFPKASGGDSSCDEDSNDSLSPRQSESREHPVCSEPVCNSAEKLAGSSLRSPIKVPPSALPFQLSSTPLNSSVQNTYGNSQIRSQRPTQKHKKSKDDKPKIKKLKYHQYIPPDKKGDTDPPPDLDSSYAKILQQQQLFLQLQILSQQQHNYHAPTAAPPKDPDPPSSSPSSNLSSTSSPAETFSAPSTLVSVQRVQICPGSAPLGAAKASSPRPNLDDMKVAELKCELKLRRLPVSGTRKDLIERLRTYQELSQGGDTIPSPTAGGSTEPELERAGTSSKTGGSFGASEAATQQLLRCNGAVKPFTRPSMLNATNLDKISFNADPPGDLMSSSASDLRLQPFTAAPSTATIKQEPRCSSPAPCHFSLKSASLQKHSLVSSAAPATTAATPPVTVDKDKMLQEKDKQIAELTRMLWHNQRLVEELQMQLENGNRDASEAQILRKVKDEPPDRSHEAFSTSPPLFDAQISVVSCEKELAQVIIKEEAIETEIGCKMLVQPPDTIQMRSPTPIQQTGDQIQLQLRPEQRSFQKQICLQDSARQLAQQQAINRLLMQQRNTKKQQHTVQRLSWAQETQKPRPQRQKKSEKPHKQIQPPPSKQNQSQLGKQQVLQRKQECKQELKKRHQQSKKLQPIQIQSRIHLQQQDSSPAMVSDSNSKNILISLTNHITGDQGSYSEGKATNHISLQKQSRQESVEQALQEAAHRPSVPPRLHSPPTWKNSPLRFYQTEMFPGLDVLLSPLSPDSVKTAASPSHDKQRDSEDFIDIILQAGETPNTLTAVQDFSFSSPSPSPLQLLLSPPNSPSDGTVQPDSPLQPEPWAPAKTSEHKHFDLCSSGHFEDFLESTTGKSLLGAEPGGLLTLFDDLHNQLMCTTSILDIPPDPIDSLDTDKDREQRLDSKEWLGFDTGAESKWETPSLVPQMPPSVFSADFLDSSDLHMGWDS